MNLSDPLATLDGYEFYERKADDGEIWLILFRLPPSSPYLFFSSYVKKSKRG